MPRRRMRFAAPLVIVTTTACGQPTPGRVPVDPPAAVEEPEDVATVSGDGGVPVYVDAAVLPFVTIIIPEHTTKPTGYVSCHNFGPHNRGCNPPRPAHYPEQRLRRQILDVVPLDKENVVVVIAVKDADEVDEYGWVYSGETRVGRVDSRDDETAQLIVKLPIETVRADAGLELQTTPKGDVVLVRARIINMDVNDSGTIIVVAAGAKDGVERGWSVEVVDERDRPAPNGKAMILKVTERTSIAKVKMTPDEVRKHTYVRLVSPDR